LGDKHPLYQQLSHEIRAYEETLQRLYTELREVVRPSLERQLIRERKEELTKLQADLAKRTITVQTLQRSLATHLTETRQLSGQGVELEQQRAELARATETLGLLTKRLIELRTERHAPQRISLMKAAIVPTEPVEWMPTQKMGLAWLLGLVAPYGLALVWERTLRRVSNAEELEELCNLAILAETPRLPDSVRPTDTATAERHSLDLAMFDESIDSLRSCLMLAEPLKHLRVLAVTSGSSKEGKTSVATKLASSLARATGEDVLLIDGDARLPDIHDLFGIPLEPGLTEVLSGRVAIGDAIQTTSCPGLHVLPAGRLPSSPHQVFRNQSVEALLGDLRSSYRYIVIDTAPVLAASETLSLAKAADTCVVCARWDFSRVDQVRAACERLLAADVNPAGIVLNGMPSTNYAFRYGGYGYAYAWPRTATPDRSANPQPHESSAKVAV
jgi:capsular exopolysaccharide synthesis family protein